MALNSSLFGQIKSNLQALRYKGYCAAGRWTLMWRRAVQRGATFFSISSEMSPFSGFTLSNTCVPHAISAPHTVCHALPQDRTPCATPYLRTVHRVPYPTSGPHTPYSDDSHMLAQCRSSCAIH
eukprot:955463-Rhodomonas_salina.2